MIHDPGDIVLMPRAGTHVDDAFSYARALAVRLQHDVIVEGNGIRVVVTPQMDEEQCRRSYERALEST